MPYQIEEVQHGFHVDLRGGITFEEIAEANDALIEHQNWSTHTYQLWSFLNASALLDDKRNSRVIGKIDGMSLNRTHRQLIKIAFVCTNSKTNEFLISYIDSVDEDRIQARIFATEAEARAWVSA